MLLFLVTKGKNKKERKKNVEGALSLRNRGCPNTISQNRFKWDDEGLFLLNQGHGFKSTIEHATTLKL